MLTSKQSRFVAEYLIDLNGKQAAIRAGYSAKTAEVQASQLLRIAKIQVALSAAIRARSWNTEVTADRVVAELAKIGFGCRRDVCWNLIGSLRSEEDTWSGSKVNRVIGEFLGQALPSVDFAHSDLT